MSIYKNFETDILKKYYYKGGVKEVQKYINRSSDSIRYKAKDLGIKRIKDFRFSKVNLNEYMYNINPETAYALGLIWGDGYVKYNKRRSSISITLQEKDFNEIKYLFPKFQIHKVKKMELSWKQCYMALIGHKKLAQFLYKHDYGVKSFVSPEKILKKIPKKYRHYFFRAWFDADGCNNGIEKGKTSLIMAGSYTQNWKAFSNLCKNLKIPFKITRIIRKNGNKYSVLRFGGYSRILRFRDYVYQGKQFGLSRKRLNFFNIRQPSRWKSVRL